MNDKQKNALLLKLANAAAASAAKNSLPVLQGPHRTADGALRFCDLDCWLSLPTPAGIPATLPGIYSPDAWKMLKAGLAVPPSDIDPADLPTVPEPADRGDDVADPVETSPEFWDAVRAVLPVASTDKTRYAQHGALLFPPEGRQPALVAATDGCRAHLVEIAHDLPLLCLGVPSSGLYRAFQDAAGRDGEGVVLLTWARAKESKNAPAEPSYTLAVWGDVTCIWKNEGFIPPNLRQVIPSEADTSDPHPISAGALKALDTYRKAAGQKNTTTYNLVTCKASVYGNVVPPYAVPGAVPLSLLAMRDKETGIVSGVEAAPVFNPAYLADMAAFAGDTSGGLGLRLSRPIREGGVSVDSLTDEERKAAPVLSAWGPALAVQGNRKAILMPMRAE